MSTVIWNKKYSRFQVLNFIIFSIVGISIMSMFVMDDRGYRERITKEITEASQILTTEDWHVVNARINSRYETYYYNNGTYDIVADMFIPKGTHPGDELIDDNIFYRAVNNISLLVYQMVYRITALEYWLALLLPFMICLFVQGYNQWRANKYRMGGANTTRSRVYMKFIWLCFISLVIIVGLPNYFAAMGVYIPGILMVVLAIVISKLVASYQKDVL